MTTRAELAELIRNGENSAVEFKRDTIQNYEIAKELVAFSNFEGGVVLLGVEDDGTISGVSRDNLEEWVMTSCRDKIRPAIIPFFELVREYENGRDVALVRVSPGHTVHAQWHNHRNTYFIRVGSQSREPTPGELERLFQRRGNFRPELRPLAGTRLNHLDMRRVEDYFGRIRQQDVPDANQEAEVQALLFNSELMVEGGITVAAVLLFGTTPNRFLPQAGIDATAFEGTEKDYNARERLAIRGPMAPLFANGQIVDNGLVERALEFVRRNTPVTHVLEDGARRTEIRTYPDEVVREAIVNALVHRDYLLGGQDIELTVYGDRMEIISPGRLPDGITPERMRIGCRDSRNQMLKDVMRDYGYLEHMGMGISRKIIRGMRDHNGTEPELLPGEETFTLRLFAE